MKTGVLKIFILSVICIYTFTGIHTFAQLNNTDVTLLLSPENPKPNEEVKATLNSYVFDLNKSNISWLVNNQLISIGIGKKSFSFNVGEFGTQTNLSVVVDTIDGQSVRKSILLTASDVDILWEAVDSFKPPFYKGKTLVSKEGSFKMVAIPTIGTQLNKINPNNLSYTWEQNGEGRPSSSGWGKTSFSFKNSYLDPSDTITVKVSDISGNLQAKDSLTVSGITPKIVIYKKDPVFGIMFNQEVKNGITLDKNGEDFIAIPYFFSSKNLSSDKVKITWTLGERQLDNLQKNELRIKPEEGKNGSAKIKIVISNIKTLFQEASKEINVNF